MGALLAAGAPARANPRLVCSADGHRVADGDRAPIDHDVACEIDDAAAKDRDLTPAIEVAIELPLGDRGHAGATMSRFDGGWRGDAFGVGGDLLRCAPATIHATLSRGDQAVWQQSLHVKPSCPAVRFARAPKLVCDGMTSIWLTTDPHPDDPDQVREAAEARTLYPRIECHVTVGHAPKDVTLVAHFRRTPPAAGDAAGDVVRVEPTVKDDGSLDAFVPEPIVDPACGAVKVDAVLVRDGGVVWTGHDTYHPKCPK